MTAVQQSPGELNLIASNLVRFDRFPYILIIKMNKLRLKNSYPGNCKVSSADKRVG